MSKTPLAFIIRVSTAAFQGPQSCLPIRVETSLVLGKEKLIEGGLEGGSGLI